MTNESQLSISTVSVDVKVVRIDGKQMTKAVFSQIETADHVLPEDQHILTFDKEVSRIIGYVNNVDHSKWILFVTPGGALRRARFDHWGYDVYPIIEKRLRDEHHLFIAV